jgi:hypothetical protein
MPNLTDELRRFREENPDVADVFESFDRANRAYRNARRALTATRGGRPEVKNSSGMVISYRSVSSSFPKRFKSK